MKYVSKHKFFVSTITSCFLNKLCSSNVLSIGIFFADTRWCSEVFPHPNSVFKVYHPLYSVLVLSLQKQPLSSHEPSLHGTEIGMWSLVSQKEKPNERVLHKPAVLKFCLEIIKTTDKQRPAEDLSCWGHPFPLRLYGSEIFKPLLPFFPCPSHT